MASMAIDYQRSRILPALATCILILSGLLALLVLGYCLDIIAPEDPAVVDPGLAEQFVDPRWLRPKPHDRFFFPAIVFCGFALLTLITALWRERLKQPFDPRAAFLLCAALSGAIALWLGLWNGLLQLFSRPHSTETLFCLLIAGIVAWISTNSRPILIRNWLLIVTFLVAALFTAATRIFTASTISYAAHITSHYEAAVYSIVHIAGGGTCLADVLPQYGCYGEFIAPIVRMIGASPLAITSTFVVVQSLALLAIVIFAAGLIRNAALLITAFSCVVILTSIILMLGSPDPYFQYNPIRLLFPALSLLCVLAFQRRPSFANAVLIGAFAGASIAWNVDTGVAVVGSLGLFILAVGFTEPGWLSLPTIFTGLKRLLCFGAGTLLFVVAFYAYLEVKSGMGVDLATGLAYQSAFYVAGFSMIPLPAFPDLWTIAAIIIVTGLLAAMAGASSRSDKMLERASYLAILSIGLMLYYTGRSHWLVLRFVVWPEVILFYYLADRFIENTGASAKMATIWTAVFLPLAATVFFWPVWSDTVLRIWKPAPESELVEQDISFLRSQTTPGEKIAIIAENQSTFYAATGTWPSLRGPSLAELQLVRDRDALKDEIAKEGPKKLFANPEPMTVIKVFAGWLNLESHYDVKATGPGGRIVYYVRRD
jgi:hypothetical protein